ncbi:MAG TPA: hypothetical protein VNH11_11830 [Pirellulales bacterium]|nr:hypothetical protein [Pirellulales bacterium]
MADEKQPQPPLTLKVLFWIFLLTFFGGGVILFANPFGHFLPEAAFAIIALAIMAEFALLFVVGAFVRVIGWHRAIRAAAEKSRNSK